MYDIFHTFLPVLQRFPFLGPFFILPNGLFQYNVPPQQIISWLRL